MNYVLISPNFTGTFKIFALRLKENGINVLGIGSAPYDDLDIELTDALDEYYKVDTLADTGAVMRAVAFLFFKHGPIDRIESHSQSGLVLDAKLREQFHVPGLKPRDTVKVVSRHKMREYVSKTDVPVFDGTKIKTINQLDKAVDGRRLPFVLIPDDITSSLPAYIIKTASDMADFKAVWDKIDAYYIQDYVDKGQLLALSGLVNNKGEVVFASSMTYHDTPTTYHIDAETNERLLQYGKEIAAIFKIKERFFHIEFLKTAEGTYTFLNYKPHPASGYALDLQNYAHSIDLYNIYAQLVLGNDDVVEVLNTTYCLGITRQSSSQYNYSIDAVVKNLGHRLKLNVPLTDNEHFFAITADSLTEIKDIKQFIEQVDN